jgi:hypothetical protein
MTPDLPWSAMLKIAGVQNADIAAATGLSAGYVSRQLNGKKPLQYKVRQACLVAIRARQREWYLPVLELVRQAQLKQWVVIDDPRCHADCRCAPTE